MPLQPADIRYKNPIRDQRTTSMTTKSYEAFAEIAKRHIPKDCYFIDPRKPGQTAAQFLDWCEKSEQPAPLGAPQALRKAVFNFLDSAAWWKTSVPGPV